MVDASDIPMRDGDVTVTNVHIVRAIERALAHDDTALNGQPAAADVAHHIPEVDGNPHGHELGRCRVHDRLDWLAEVGVVELSLSVRFGSDGGRQTKTVQICDDQTSADANWKDYYRGGADV